MHPSGCLACQLASSCSQGVDPPVPEPQGAGCELNMKALRLVQQKGRLPLIRREQLRLLCAETSCVVQFDAAAAQRLIYRRRGVRALGGPCLFTFLHPIYYICPSFSPSLLVVTQIRGHTAGSCPPLPTRVRALHSYLENISALSSLVDSRRVVHTHARRSQQLLILLFCK